MFHQIDNKTIHKGQFSLPGGECHDPLFSKIIMYHISHFTKTVLETFESDTESCFDRIVMPLALVCFMIWGAPLAAILMWDFTLQHI